ncbi:MAG: cyclic-di-AMP receptor [Clostridium sp.]|nr:MAG: cyclic-di-AMP receptor [Clostridium sp.]
MRQNDYAVLSGGNATETVRDLTARGFYTTMLSSTGGFLKKKSVTLLIGVERAQVDTVLEILEKHAKKHIEASFVTSPDVTGVAVKTLVKVETGGTVAFVMDVFELRQILKVLLFGLAKKINFFY